MAWGRIKQFTQYVELIYSIQKYGQILIEELLCNANEDCSKVKAEHRSHAMLAAVAATAAIVRRKFAGCESLACQSTAGQTQE